MASGGWPSDGALCTLHSIAACEVCLRLNPLPAVTDTRQRVYSVELPSRSDQLNTDNRQNSRTGSTSRGVDDRPSRGVDDRLRSSTAANHQREFSHNPGGVRSASNSNSGNLPQRQIESVSGNYADLPPAGEGREPTQSYHGARPRSEIPAREDGGSPQRQLQPITRHIDMNQPIMRHHVTGSSNDSATQVEASRRSSSFKQTIDSFIKATKKKFSVKPRRNSDDDLNENQALAPATGVIPTWGHVEQIPALPTPVQPGGGNNHQIIPVMNMGRGSPPQQVTEDGEFPDISSVLQIRAHTTVDYLHYLVPGLASITNCGFYWGIMDRYEAEALLDDKPEGTFLLRDSSQDDFIFSVSFRRYGRSLHARVEQWSHKFSFDAHDSGVYKAESVTALIEHYKDPQTCMFFEPMLTRPLNRPHTFSLLHVARAVVCDNISYDAIDNLNLPKHLQEYCRYYHYKQKIRVRTHSSNNNSSRELQTVRGGHYS